MKRIVVILVLLAFVSSFVSYADDYMGASLKFDTCIHDFGQVLISDGPVEYSFRARNVSSRPVVIQSVTTSCGCTRVKFQRDEIAPGATTFINASYTNDEGPYPFDKTLTVSIVGERKPVILHLRGISTKEKLSDRELFPVVYSGTLGLQDDNFKCGNIEQGSSRGEQTTMANLSGGNLTVGFRCVADGLSLNVEPNPIPAYSHSTLHFTVSSRPDKWGYNDYSAEITINGKPTGKTVRIRAFTAENFSSLTKEQKSDGSRPVFRESTFSFGHLKAGKVVNAVFTCENKGKKVLAVHKADADIKGATFGDFPEIAPGESGKFQVRFDTSNLPKGEALVVITLTTNSPLRPIVTLFLAGWID